MVPFPRLRLRDPAIDLVDLPWELPLAEWPEDGLAFREIPIGPSRHLVRFLLLNGVLYALKELPLGPARREYRVLLHLEGLGLPTVEAAGVAEAPATDSAILVTKFLPHSLQYRRLMMRLPPSSGVYRERLLDAMSFLLVDLHRSGVFWGDCSLANTLFRRDGNRIQAYLVDAETSEIHPTLSDGQRAYDLDILVENVGFGLADLGVMQQRADAFEDAVEASNSVRTRYRAVWDELHLEPTLSAADRQAIRARIRRLNELGFAIDEISLEPTSPGGEAVRLKVAVADRRFHARELARLTGLVALEGQARLLMNDLREYGTWLRHRGASLSEDEAADRWIRDVLEPSLATLVPVIGPQRDPLQAYCDVLELKWLRSEAAGSDIGLGSAIREYIEMGAPAPEDVTAFGDSSIVLDIDWSTGLDSDGQPA